MKYIHIINFLLTNNLTHLKGGWQAEVANNKKINFYQLLKLFVKPIFNKKEYLFWWRLANEMSICGNKKQKEIAHKIQKN